MLEKHFEDAAKFGQGEVPKNVPCSKILYVCLTRQLYFNCYVSLTAISTSMSKSIPLDVIFFILSRASEVGSPTNPPWAPDYPSHNY